MTPAVPQSDADIRLSKTLLVIWKIFHAPRMQMKPREMVMRILWAIMTLPAFDEIYEEAKQHVDNPGYKEASDF